MRVVCVICTEQFLINSPISACPCGHVFHEECLFRWLKSSQHPNCPQCRAKVKESAVIKRLYLTEASDSSLSSTQLLLNTNELTGNGDENCSEALKQRYQDICNKVQELKAELNDKKDSLTCKSKTIEQKEKKIKELEESMSSNKKKLGENQLLIDYLKKELEAYERLKEKCEKQEKTIFELESKLREFKSVESIYKDNQESFTAEMGKYIVNMNNTTYLQTAVRQLVHMNVLLKKSSDKNGEEKRQLRKKLQQVEKSQSEKDKFLASKEKEIQELRETLADAEAECERLKRGEAKKPSIRVDDTPQTQAVSSSRLHVTDDSDLQYIEEVALMDTDSNKKETYSLSPFVVTPVQVKKRKNPFLKQSDSEDEDQDTDEIRKKKEKLTLSVLVHEEEDKKISELEIPSFQVKNPTRQASLKDLLETSSGSLSSKSTKLVVDEEIDFVRPINSLPKSNRLLAKTKSFSMGESKRQAANTKKLDESVEIKPMPTTNYYFQYDGLGNRKRVAVSSKPSSESNLRATLLNSVASSTLAGKSIKLTRSKISQ